MAIIPKSSKLAYENKMEQYKRCTKCHQEKPIDEYLIIYSARRKDGTRKARRHSRCKECINNIKRKWRKENPAKCREYLRRATSKGLTIKRKKKHREQLSDHYIINMLSARIGQKAEFIRQYPDLIESQRLIIKTIRLCKTLKNSDKA